MDSAAGLVMYRNRKAEKFCCKLLFLLVEFIWEAYIQVVERRVGMTPIKITACVGKTKLS